MSRLLARYSFLLLCACLGWPAATHAQKADKRTTFFVGRLRYSQNDGDDCGSVAQELGNLLRRASTIEVPRNRSFLVSISPGKRLLANTMFLRLRCTKSNPKRKFASPTILSTRRRSFS